jgi:hypothetical protein
MGIEAKESGEKLSLKVQEAEIIEKTAAKEELDASELQKTAKAIELDCLHDLEEIQPTLDAANLAVSNID